MATSTKRLSSLTGADAADIGALAVANGAAKTDLSNLSNATTARNNLGLGSAAIDAAVDARIALGAAGVNNKFWIDPHLPPYNAKGDGMMVKDGLVPSGQLDRFSSAYYTFTSADIGKSVWCFDSGVNRAITAVSGGKAIVDNAFPSWFPGQGATLVMQWGHDDTAALQAAIDAAQTYQAAISEYTTSHAQDATAWLTGAVVRLRAGHSYIIQNSSASWNDGAGKKSALVIKRKTGLLGAGKHASKLICSLSHYGHGIATAISQDSARTLPYVDQVELGGFNITMNGDINTNAWDAIHFAAEFDGYPNVDPVNFFHDIFIQAPGRDGYYVEGRGEAVHSNIYVTDAGRYGIHFQNHPDYKAVCLNAGGSGKTGIRVQKARSGQWMNCKAYYSGKDPTGSESRFVKTGNPAWAAATDYTDKTGQVQKGASLEGVHANFHLFGDYVFGGSCVFTACEAQESSGSSWVIEANDTVLNGCKAADPGRISYGPILASRPSVITGFHLKGQWATNGVFSDCVVTSELGVSDTQNMGYATSAVYVDALASGKGPQKNKGDVYFTESFTRGDNGATWAPNWNGGSSSGMGGATANGANTKLRVNGVALT